MLLIFILRAGLDKVAKSILKSLDNSFQLPMHLRVIEFSPYLVVDEYGVNTHPKLEFLVLILCTSLIF